MGWAFWESLASVDWEVLTLEGTNTLAYFFPLSLKNKNVFIMFIHGIFVRANIKLNYKLWSHSHYYDYICDPTTSVSLSAFLSLCLSVCLSACLLAILSLVSQSVCLPVSLSACLCLSVNQSVCLSVYPSARLHAWLPTCLPASYMNIYLSVTQSVSEAIDCKQYFFFIWNNKSRASVSRQWLC